MIRVLVLNRFAHSMSLVFFTPCKHQKKSGFLTSIFDSNACMNLHFKIAFKFCSYLLSMNNTNNAYFGIPTVQIISFSFKFAHFFFKILREKTQQFLCDGNFFALVIPLRWFYIFCSALKKFISQSQYFINAFERSFIANSNALPRLYYLEDALFVFSLTSKNQCLHQEKIAYLASLFL